MVLDALSKQRIEPFALEQKSMLYLKTFAMDAFRSVRCFHVVVGDRRSSGSLNCRDDNLEMNHALTRAQGVAYDRKVHDSCW